MPRTSREYWNRRMLQDKARVVNNAERYLQKEQKRLYSQTAKEIQDEIEKLYETFADQQNITLAEAKRRIRDADFKKIDFDAMVEESLDLLRKIREGNLPEEVLEELERQHKLLEDQLAALSKRGQISYLDMRRIEIEKKLLSLYDAQQQNIYDYLQSEYEDSYYRQVYNTQQQVGYGYDFVQPNAAAVDRAILNTYNRENFSKTLYAHCKHFSKDLRDSLTVGLIRGESLDKIARRIQGRMGVALSAAKRLVRTETAYVYEQATKAAYEESGVEWYEYMATLDNKTSEVCRDLDGKRFRVKDAKPGENYPPMHPNCRSTTVCFFPEDEGKRKYDTRLARDENGRTYEVPASMTYREWQKKYGQEADDRGKRRLLKQDERNELKKPIGLSEVPYAKEILRTVERNPSPAARLLLKYYDQIRISNTSAKGGGVYRPSRKTIRYNAEYDREDPRGRHTTLFHKIGHMIDDLTGRMSETGGFREALQEDGTGLFRTLLSEGICDTMEEAYRYVNRRMKEPSYHAVRDLLRATTDLPIEGDPGMHTKEYWQKPGKLEHEAFAQFFSASLVEDEEKQKSLQQTFPHAWRIFEEMMKDG